jgi:dTDP-4-dehydrorhamnose reductase
VKLLVLGTKGQLGMCLSDKLRITEYEVFYTTRAEIDICDFVSLNQMIRQIAPDIVVNTTAYTEVDTAEDEPEKAGLVNHLAVAKIAEICTDIGAVLIHISTDYVFDGKASAPYKEGDQTNPQGVYGKTKLLGDLAINQSGCKYLIIRTSWVFSEYGQNFMKTMLRLGAERDELNIVTDQIGCPTYGQDIAKTIVSVIPRLAINNMDSGIYHYCGDQSCSWFEFAEAIFAQATNAGFKTPDLLKPITTAEYPTPASRPAYSVLDCSKTLNEFGISPSDWREGIQEVLYKMKNIK